MELRPDGRAGATAGRYAPDGHPEIGRWIADWSGTPDHVDFLAYHTTAGQWLAFSRVVRPEFVRARGCVIWERAYEPDGFEEWFRHLDGDVVRVEAMLNRFVAGDHVTVDDTAEGNAVLREVADTVAMCWEAALRTACPGRRFDVRVRDTDDGPVVGFTSAPERGQDGDGPRR
ncbi:hypothetical protein [Streptomyces huiliensis]|uniref:hypothetical protein n=1 Tax=Streptomyces huiliensis TaxID=2876027 RepID=UPI001CBCB822|nr:hypothetical protein [Streptomyces huiliensis]MBZ4318134.1 hypothetical protein [Streptomyces huiliensis]